MRQSRANHIQQLFTNKLKEKNPRVFSQECQSCKDWLRGEVMWKWKPYDSGRRVWICKMCAPTLEDLIEKVFELEFVCDTELVKNKEFLLGKTKKVA
jgi:hypothetical protein